MNYKAFIMIPTKKTEAKFKASFGKFISMKLTASSGGQTHIVYNPEQEQGKISDQEAASYGGSADPFACATIDFDLIE